MNTEQWKSIIGFHGYEVSTHGQIRRYWKMKGLGKARGAKRYLSDTPILVKPSPN